MINDIMSILPIKVWLFWVIVSQIAMAFFAYKGYKQIITNHAGLAALISSKKEINDEPV